MVNLLEKINNFKKNLENDYKFENLSEIENLQKENNLTEMEDIELNSLLVRYYVDLANYSYALKKSWELKEKSEKISNLPYTLMSIAYILESLQPLGRANEGEDLIEVGNNILNKISNSLDLEIQKIIGQFLFIKGLIYQELEYLEKSYEIYKKSLIIRRRIQDEMGIAKCLLHISNYFEFKSNFKIALKYINESLLYSKSFKPNMCTAWAYLQKALINLKIGKFDEVLENANNGFEISKLIGNTHSQDFYYDILGDYYRESGKYSKSLECLKKSLTLKKKRNHIIEIGDCYYDIGTLYSYQGKLNLALEYYQKLLEIKEIDADSYRYVNILSLYGKILGEKGEYDDAIMNLEKSLALGYEHNMVLENSRILHYLICLSLNKQKKSEAKKYLEQIEKILDNNQDNKRIMQIHQLDEALILMNNGSYQDKIISRITFSEIMNYEILQIEITIDAMLNLVEILLFELKISGDVSILDEIREIILKLLNIGTKENSSYLVAEVLLFQAKLKLIEGKIPDARILLTEAQKVAESNELGRLANKISDEHDTLLTELKKWEELHKNNVPLKERIKNVNFSFIFSKIVRNFTHEIKHHQEYPIFILIWSKKGIALFEYEFQQSGFKIKKNIVGILSTIDIVGKEALLSKGFIDRIKFEEKTIIVRTKDHIKFAYAFEKQSYNAIKNLELLISKITNHHLVWNSLINSALTGEVIDKTVYNSIVFIINQIF